MTLDPPRCTDVCDWLQENQESQGGWLCALNDPEIGQALAIVHAEPGHDWSVESLVHEVAKSRSSFSAKFTQVLGMPPMTYVQNWRMTFATSKLREPDASILQIAHQCRYASEVAFAHAYKKVMGIGPGTAKRGKPIELPPLYTE